MNKVTTLMLGAALLATLGHAPRANAVPVEPNDGTKGSLYGAALGNQQVQTGFGDSNLGVSDYANGSEIDGIYAFLAGGELHVLLTGNLESNYNKVELYLDTKAGGQNVLRTDNPNVDYDGLNRQSGLKFDTAFSPDYWLSFSGGYDGSGYRLYGNYAELATNGGGAGYYLGSNTAATTGALSGGTNPNNIQITINNSNTGGVGGGCGSADGSSVTTGMEFLIPVAAIGNPSGCIKLCAFINGSSHDYLANQVVGSLPVGTCNLGDPHNVDFSTIAGDQFVTLGCSVEAKKTTWGALKSIYR